MITNYSRTLRDDDYNYIGEIQHIQNMHYMLQGVTHRFEHPHRAWEYGLASHVIRKRYGEDKSLYKGMLLDVGGGGSVFAPAMAWLGYSTLQVDPGDVGKWITDQDAVVQKIKLEFVQQDFLTYKDKSKYDFVTCLSVIEHVPDHEIFFDKLMDYVKPGGLLVLTTDFHPTGQAQVAGHIRTYNEQTLEYYIHIAQQQGFDLYGGGTDYNYFKPDVNNYTFASLVLINNNPKKTKSKKITPKKKIGATNYTIQSTVISEESAVPAEESMYITRLVKKALV